MRTQSFISFATKYADIAAGKSVSLSFGGKIAVTDGRNINLPALPSDTMMTPWETKVFTGYLEHEIGHVKYTNFADIRIKNPTKPGPDFQKMVLIYFLFNLFEDIREENRYINDVPAVRTYLDATGQYLEYQRRDKKEQVEQTTGGIVLEVIYKKAYQDYREADLVYQTLETIEQFPELAAVKSAMTKLRGLQSTKAAVDLAEEVYELLPKNKDYQQKSEGTGDPGELFILMPGSGTFPIQVLMELMDGHDRGGTLAEFVAGMGKSNDDSLPGKAQINWGDRVLPPMDMSHDRIFVPSHKNRVKFEAVRSTANTEITALKKMLNIALRARTKKAWEKGLDEGILDDEGLPKLFLGDTDFFKQKRIVLLPDTAIQVMVDLSGSMSTTSTMTAAIILAEALTGISAIKLSIAGFTTGSYGQQYRLPVTAGRAVNLVIPLFKDFGESYASSRDRLGALSCTGSTPLGDAYGLGFSRLMMRKEPKKVLWIVTDGEPCIAAGPRHSEPLMMKKIYRRCKQNGIYVIGTNIGRLGKDLKENSDAAFGVGSSNELPKEMLKVMKELMK